jgi:hypothetical protein
MAVTKQGLRFYREQTPKEAAFIDSGRVIRVYKQDEETLLAALQLAQEKWGGVKISGSDEYKRRSAKIAAEHGIRVVNPELQGVKHEIEQRLIEQRLPIRANLEREEQKEQATVKKELSDAEKSERLHLLIAKAKELARDKLRLKEGFLIVTSGFDGREYHGTFLGVVEQDRRYIAVQALNREQMIMYDVEERDLPKLETFIGRKVNMTGGHGDLRNIEDADFAASINKNRDRGWSR